MITAIIFIINSFFIVYNNKKKIKDVLLNDALLDVDFDILDSVSVDNFPVLDENPVLSALRPIKKKKRERHIHNTKR